MNTIGHERLTTIAHVINGHCHEPGNDHRRAPGPEQASPSSGKALHAPIEKFSLPTHAIITAGTRMHHRQNDWQSNRAQAIAGNGNSYRDGNGDQRDCGGNHGVARMASA